MQTTEIQNPPPDMPVDWAVWIQTTFKQIHHDLNQLGMGLFVDINGNVGVGTENSGGYKTYIKQITQNQHGLRVEKSPSVADTAQWWAGVFTHSAGPGSTLASKDYAGRFYDGKFAVEDLPIYANNAAAITGGLVAGNFYRTGGDPDPVCVVH